VDANIDTAFIIAFAGFLYIGEIIYLNRKVKDFSTIRALYNNIRIAPDSHLIIFYLKQSKTNKIYSGVNIQITAILGDCLYPIAVIIYLFNCNP
jgi:hypothetical protein